MNRWYRVGLAALVVVVAVALLAQSRGGGPIAIPSIPGVTGAQSAPEFEGIVSWINSKPLTMKALRGKVVIIDFWTYSCVNCQRTLPYLRRWHEKYADKGLVIVGVHSPEFDFEKDVGNVRRAVNRYEVTWPVAVDSDMATWGAYRNNYWPHKYLIGRDGNVRFDHIGEGGYRETEEQIQALLSEGGKDVRGALEEESAVPVVRGQTPELYAGKARGGPVNAGKRRSGDLAGSGDSAEYALPERLSKNSLHAEGVWVLTDEALVHARQTPLPQRGYPADAAVLRFQAKDVYVVTSGDTGDAYKVYLELDGKPYPRGAKGPAGKDVRFDESGRAYIDADLSTLYHVVSLDRPGDHVLRLSSPSRSFAIFAFTFGS